jgi:hypothetical protein
VPLPDAQEIEDIARLGDYEAAWTSLRSDGTRCFWRWNLGRQQPGFPFPTAFAGRSIVRFFDHETVEPGLGFQASYAIVDEQTLDLYAYHGARDSARSFDREEDDRLAEELARASDAMLVLKSRVLNRDAELVATGTLAAAFPGGHPIRCARFRLASAGRAAVSFVMLARFRGLFLKLRLTLPECEDVDLRAEQAAGWLAAYVVRLESDSAARAQPAMQGAA